MMVNTKSPILEPNLLGVGSFISNFYLNKNLHLL